MDGESCLIQVSLKLKPGRLDELLVLRFVGNVRNLAGNIGAADPFQIDVEVAVRSRQQSGRLRRGMLAQHDSQGDGGDNQHHAKEDGESTSYAHEIRPPRCQSATIREQ